MFMKVKESYPVTMAEAKEVMSKYNKQKELGYEQNIALEHLNKFTKLKSADAKKFMEELNSILRMSPETAVQIANIMPNTADELRVIFARESFSLKEEEVTKILDLVKKYS